MCPKNGENERGNIYLLQQTNKTGNGKLLTVGYHFAHQIYFFSLQFDEV